MKGRGWQKRAFLLRITITTLAVIVLSSCAVKVKTAPVGGSRADGTIRLAYEFGELEVPEVNWAEADQQAQDRCQHWGYTGAERFGGGMQQCIGSGAFGGCGRYRVSIEYQCLGDLEK